MIGKVCTFTVLLAIFLASSDGLRSNFGHAKVTTKRLSEAKEFNRRRLPGSKSSGSKTWNSWSTGTSKTSGSTSKTSGSTSSSSSSDSSDSSECDCSNVVETTMATYDTTSSSGSSSGGSHSGSKGSKGSKASSSGGSSSGSKGSTAGSSSGGSNSGSSASGSKGSKGSTAGSSSGGSHSASSASGSKTGSTAWNTWSKRRRLPGSKTWSTGTSTGTTSSSGGSNSGSSGSKSTSSSGGSNSGSSGSKASKGSTSSSGSSSSEENDCICNGTTTTMAPQPELTTTEAPVVPATTEKKVATTTEIPIIPETTDDCVAEIKMTVNEDDQPEGFVLYYNGDSYLDLPEAQSTDGDVSLRFTEAEIGDMFLTIAFYSDVTSDYVSDYYATLPLSSWTNEDNPFVDTYSEGWTFYSDEVVLEVTLSYEDCNGDDFQICADDGSVSYGFQDYFTCEEVVDAVTGETSYEPSALTSGGVRCEFVFALFGAIIGVFMVQ